MEEDLDIVTLGTLIGQPARAAMLLTLMDGRGRTATELADIAETTRSTASFHLSQLVEGKVIRAPSPNAGELSMSQPSRSP